MNARSNLLIHSACSDCAKGNFLQCFHDQCITADGVERGFVAVNRQLPGPPIQVCKGDIVIVDVDNEMDGTATTIHWHGLRQFGTPFSDGVPFITQCPIYYGTTFRYSFHADDAGTHLYHSHAGQHKANGIYGAIIVRKSEEYSSLYDYDLPHFYMLAADWMHVYAEQYFPGLTSRLSIFESLLINGHGRFLNVRILFVACSIFSQNIFGHFLENFLFILGCSIKHLQRRTSQTLSLSSD